MVSECNNLFDVSATNASLWSGSKHGNIEEEFQMCIL
jgi:hypothetical protein